MTGSSLRRALGGSPIVRSITGAYPVARVIAATVRGRLLAEPLSFAARELSGTHRAFAYHLRQSGLTIHLRHNTPDCSVLDEIFLHRFYEPPPPAAECLGALRRRLRIADLGANIGLFGAFAFARWDVEALTAFEPDAANARLHAQTIAANGLSARWRLIEAGASTTEGRMRFRSGMFTDSRPEAAGVISNEVGRDGATDQETVRAVDSLAALAEADLVKMDIEGGEWAILTDDRFASLTAAAIVLEYHPHLAPGPDAGAVARIALEDAGYHVLPMFHDDRGHGMLWGWREPRDS